MNALIAAAFSRPRTVVLGLVVILFAGALAYRDIPKESSPDIDIPTIYVSMTHQGISPEDAERLLVKPMEQELRSIEGLKELSATASEGHASVIMEFEAGFDPDKALDDVRNQVDIAKADLPDETDEPTVNQVNVALFPVLVVNLYGDVSERVLVNLAEDVQDAVEAIPGVLEADIAGDRDEQIEINIDPLKLETYNLSLEEVFNSVQQNNQLVPAGAIESGAGRFSIKVPGVIDNLAALRNTAVKQAGDQVVTVGDVASVRRSYADRDSYARLNGAPTLALEVTKRIGANIIDTNAAVRDTVLGLQQNWPDAVQVNFSQDASKDVVNLLGDLQNNVVSGILLVMIVIVGILGLRAGTLVGVSIPGSFLLGILVLAAMGLSVNIVVLFALILALGLLVDGAIVVVELADRFLADGETRSSAYMHAAQRMAWPIISSTATTLAAFAPLLFWPGVVGEFMRYMPITLIAVLSASLLMAMIFVPTLGAVIGGSAPGGADAVWQPGQPLRGFTGRYVAALEFFAGHAGKTVIGAVLLFFAAIVAYGTFGKGVEFFPNISPDNAVIQIHARGQLSVDESDRLVRQVEDKVLAMHAFESVYTRTGTSGQGAFRQGTADDVIGQVQLEFKPWGVRRPAEQVLADVREQIADIPGIRTDVQKQEQGPTQAKPVELEIAGPGGAALDKATDFVRRGMAAVGGFTDIQDTRSNQGLEWRIDVDRAEASRYGANVATIGQAIQLVTQGIKVGEYRPDDATDELDIRVRFPDHARNLQSLDDLRVQTASGLVPISNFVDRVAAPKVETIERTDGQRTITVESGVADGKLVAAQLTALRDWIGAHVADAGLNPRVDITFKGESEDLADAESFLSKAFGVAVALIGVILLTQFNSFYQSFLILSAVLFSTIGVLLGLLIAGQPFGVVMSGIGVIALAGIVVNNNIVLIDTYNVNRATGMDAWNAVRQTGAERLRPVILTTVTTILGLLPMVLQMNVDILGRSITFGAPSTQWWTQLATAIVGGLLFSTLLTLILTPCMLILGARAAERWARRREASS
ncbi:efflux RND transporter permease subunit [Salinisphaera aquimarina]|uniref:Efflux RND transporter permease subunit n=1 Tax=Salinisphaera aquimarina TaxID=2094031 RepID=A0ABV7ERK6_9GAMM